MTQEVVQFVQYAYNGLDAYEQIRTAGAVMAMGDYLNLWTTVGASGAVYGILLAFGMTFPDNRIFIFPLPVPIKAKYFVAGYAVIELLSGFGSSNDGVATLPTWAACSSVCSCCSIGATEADEATPTAAGMTRAGITTAVRAAE